MLGTQFGANLIPAVSRPPGLGRVYYVQLGGSDDNNGIDPSTPFLKIQHAIDECENDHNDYIYVLDCLAADVATINVNKNMVHIIGLAQPTPGIWPQLSGGGTHDVFNLTASYCKIAGFGFSSPEFAGISIPGGADRCWIHHCNFAQVGVALQDGIIGLGGDSPSHSLIEDCYFGMWITRDGYRGMPTNTTFRRNIFRNVGTDAVGIGINVTGGCEIGAIIENYFFKTIDDLGGAGWGITLPAGSWGGLIMNNRGCQTGHAAAGQNPYLDASGTGIADRDNGWCNNYRGEGIAIIPD